MLYVAFAILLVIFSPRIALVPVDRTIS